MKLSNEKLSIELNNGIISALYDLNDNTHTNLVIPDGNTGGISYTLITDDITRTAADMDFVMYIDRKNNYDYIDEKVNQISCKDSDNKIKTTYYLDDDLVVESVCKNDFISEFAINFDLNFMGMAGSDYTEQLLPTSPYTSSDGKYMYIILTRPNGRLMVIMSEKKADGWKIDYSPTDFCHYIDRLQIISSFDRIYNDSNTKEIKLRVFFADSISQAYEAIAKRYSAPYCKNIISGGFYGCAISYSHDTEQLEILSPSGKKDIVQADKSGLMTFNPKEYGMYIVTPIKCGVKGLNTTVWYGMNDMELFRKSCDTVKSPYHVDMNLCEGGMFLWSLLVYMNKTGSDTYNPLVLKELETIMGENGENVERKTILPYKTEKYDAYHISNSDRIQEQFTGISILLEAYKKYGNDKYLNHAICALEELHKNRIDNNGMIFRYNDSGIMEDYTTVYVPMISIVDMAVYLKKKEDSRGKVFAKLSVLIADFLVERDLSFPTEGSVNPKKNDEMEDGSISCTALSVLYVYHYIKQDKKYLSFAHKVLKLHDTWAIYTPDARMYQSSFRWWETIWEGDGAGPAICAGHAWTIWRAEALFLYGISTYDDESLIKSWNGFVTNFAKITADGKSYTCYEADYIRGGGSYDTRKVLLQLQNEDISKSYTIAHGYPKHFDSSLSRYVWIRYSRTWLDTAAIVSSDGKTVGINAEYDGNKWIIGKNIKYVYIGNIDKTVMDYNGKIIAVDNGKQIISGE